MIVGLPAKCRNCDARYREVGWVALLVHMVFSALSGFFLLWALFTWSLWPFVVAFVLALVMCFVLPVELHRSDPTNRVILRANKNA